MGNRSKGLGVLYYAKNRKRPIAESTVAIRNLLATIQEEHPALSVRELKG